MWHICYHKAFNNKEPGNTNFTDHKNKLLDRARYFAEQAVKIDPSYEADSLLYQDEESQAYLKNRSELDALQDGISESWLDSSLAKQYISELKILREEWLQEWGLHRPTGHSLAAKQFASSPTIAGTTEDDLPTQPYVSSTNQSSQNILSAHGTSNPTTHVTESSILEGDVREVNPITFSLPQIEIRDPGLNSQDLLRNAVLKVVTSNGVFYGAFTPLTPRMNR